MIFPWMLYAMAVAAVLGATGLALERVLLAAGRPTRWLWLAVLLASALAPVALPSLPERGAAGGAGATVRLGAPTVVAVAATPGTPWGERALAAGWVAASGALLAGLLGSAALLARRRRRWRRRAVGGTAVLVSEDTGPAVVGFLWPEVVVPAWVLELDEGSQRLLVEHEREHERAGDQHLLLAALAALVALPWSLPLWWQVRRLRLAVEVDCDARVLRRRPVHRAYGLLLLEVGRRASGARVPAAAFSERGSLLERRIRVLAGAARPRRPVLLALCSAALLAPVAVYAIPAPDRPALARALAAEPAPLPAPPPALAGDTIPEGVGRAPTFTPFDTKPELQSRAEFGRLLDQAYPAALRDAGIGGTSVLWVFIDETGAVRNVRLTQSSGHEPLDRVALEVMKEAQFTPALNRGEAVPVWIQLPVTFQPRAAVPDSLRAPVDTIPIWRSGLGDPDPPAGESPRVLGRPATGDTPTFTPFTDRPELVDGRALRRLLEEDYPAALREARIGGTVVFWVFVDGSGTVARARVAQSSGHPELDAAAERAVREVRFRPALNDGEPVAVWIQLPVSFFAPGSPR